MISTTCAFVTTQEMCALLHISERTLARRRSRGEILAPLPGTGRPRWLRREVEDWVQAGCPLRAAPAARRRKRQAK